ncbi:alpha/beta hydrolase family protein [Parvularcula marina]|uniref:Alpha/beta fold hydrolase n=1 Tax=Parvularcula marina TaxID=2292771 RepID=A0A371RK63_9PROT|nr:alpha/beta fold hydrolase [Parvularcula marina]RFB05842.1 alpha/beta fold hydrolase [Parvularcula marina]
MADPVTLPDEITEEAVRVTARDGFSLSALWLRPPAAKGALLVSTGTGYPKEFYLRFARAAAERGFACLLFDWRGIGGSAPEDLAAMKMDYSDWGRLDFPAMFEALRAGSGTDGPHLHVGHSAGGHMVGFADNHALIDAHAFICVGSGYWGNHLLWYRPAALWFWHGWGAWSLAQHGYVKRGGGWTGRPLPRGVFETWKRWCHDPSYYRRELEEKLRPHHFEDVTAPIRSFIYKDDPIATPKTGQHMLDAYPNAPSELVVASAADFGLSAIRHDGPFPKRSLAAAEPVLEWLDSFLIVER